MRETESLYIFLEHQFNQQALWDMYSPNGIKYNCCEQYMMHQKALLSNDLNTAAKILTVPDPAQQKELGRQAKNFDAKKWEQHKYGVVWYGNFLKFTQHEDLAKHLIKTGSKILVEANPADTIWGVGLSESDDAILDANNWRGQNLLGQVLMSIRSALQVKQPFS